MEFGRLPKGGGVTVADKLYSGYSHVPEDENPDGFELEQTAMAALKELDDINRNTNGMTWANAYDISAKTSSYDVRQYRVDDGSSYPTNLSKSPTQQRTTVARLQHATQTGLHQQPPRRSSMHRHSSGNAQPATLSASAVERNDYRQVAEFLLNAKSNDEAATLDLLRGVFLYITNPDEPISTETHNWNSAVRNGPPYLTPEDQAAAQAQLVMNQHNSILLQAQKLGVSPRAPPILPIKVYGDEIDQRLSTLVVLIPGRAHIVGHLIGKGGAEVGRIERDMSVTIKIESANKLGTQLVERSVSIIGSVAAITLAQQHVSSKVHEKLLSEGVQAEVLKMVVPNEIVRHVIGKNGANINRLQSESGARIQVEPESTMSPGSVARTIVLQGAERCRTFAQYLILRQIAEDRTIHTEWANRLHVTNGVSSPVSSTGHAPLSPLPAGNSASGGGVNLFTSPQAPPSGIVRTQGSAAEPSTESEVITVNIPEAAVAFLIGRGGSSVMEIQNQTGAHIHIARAQQNGMSGLGGMDELRRITVSGSLRSVEAAQQLIRSRVHLALNGGISPQPSNFNSAQSMFATQNIQMTG